MVCVTVCLHTPQKPQNDTQTDVGQIFYFPNSSVCYVLQKAEKPNGTSNGTTLHKASNGHMSNGHGRSRVGFETNAYDMRGWREVGVGLFIWALLFRGRP